MCVLFVGKEKYQKNMCVCVWSSQIYTIVFDVVCFVCCSRAPLHMHELVNCRWAEEVTQQLVTLQNGIPSTSSDNSDEDKWVQSMT